MFGRSLVFALGAMAFAGGCAQRDRGNPPRDLRARMIGAPPGTDVAEYTISARLEGSHRVIEASEHVVWRNRSDHETDVLWWHLYMNAFDASDTLFMRSGGASGHRGHTPGMRGRIELTTLRLSTGEDLLASSTNDENVPRDRTQLRTPLPHAVRPGESITMDVTFRTTLPATFARTGYFDDFSFAGQWFPKLAVLESDGTWAHFPFHANTEFYADFARYDVTLTVPHGDRVGACGIEIEPAPPSADSDRHHFVAEHVHDFAWTAWRSFEERWQTINSTAVRVLSPPGLATVVTRSLESLARAMPAFAARYGPYPYPQLTLVIPPRGAGGVGGMEYPTLITTEGEWFIPSSVHAVEWVTIHEFAHQYFYGLFASNEWAWPFLDEGLAEYSTGRVMTDWYGSGRELFDGLGLGLGYHAFEGGLAGSIDDALPVASGSSVFPSYRPYGDHVYRRTAAILESAEVMFGRERLDRGLQNYAARARFTHPTPDVLFDALREVDPALGEFVRRGLVGPGSLDDSITEVLSQRDSNGWITRVAVRHAGELAIPRQIAISLADGRDEVMQTNGRTEALTTHTNSPAVAATLDRSSPLPCDQNALNDARLASGSPAASDAAITARLAFWLEALLRTVGP